MILHNFELFNWIRCRLFGDRLIYLFQCNLTTVLFQFNPFIKATTEILLRTSMVSKWLFRDLNASANS